MPHILTIPRTQAPVLPPSGCWAVTDWSFLASATWQERAAAELDEQHLQLIPYLLLQSAAGQVWCYQRVGGDARLHGRCSCGVGGHVDDTDAQHLPSTGTSYTEDSCQRKPDMGQSPISYIKIQPILERALLRELAEELGATATDLAHLACHGLIYEGHSPVGRVHLGVLYTAQWLPTAPPQPLAGEALQALGFRSAQAIADDDAFELWSRLATQLLADI